MKKYSDLIDEIKNSDNFKNSTWGSINPEYVARMQLQNRFKSGKRDYRLQKYKF